MEMIIINIKKLLYDINGWVNIIEIYIKYLRG